MIDPEPPKFYRYSCLSTEELRSLDTTDDENNVVSIPVLRASLDGSRHLVYLAHASGVGESLSFFQKRDMLCTQDWCLDQEQSETENG